MLPRRACVVLALAPSAESFAAQALAVVARYP